MTSQEFNQELMRRFLIEIAKKDRSGVYALTQRNMAYNSNKIEGSRLSEDHTASLFETGTIVSEGEFEVIRAKDIEETNGHFLMFNHMVQTAYDPLSEDLIKQYHYDLKNGVFEDKANGYVAGGYKLRKNLVSNIETVLPQDVPEAMQNLLEDYHKKEIHTIEDLARLHAAFEKIHPFQDGNGRTGRMILFKECIKNDLTPFIVRDKNRDVYMYALHKAQIEGDYHYLAAYFTKEQESYHDLARDFIFPIQPQQQKQPIKQPAGDLGKGLDR